MKKWIYNVLFILCVAVVVYAALKIYNQKEEYKKAETEYEQLQKKEKNIDDVIKRAIAFKRKANKKYSCIMDQFNNTLFFIGNCYLHNSNYKNE